MDRYCCAGPLLPRSAIGLPSPATRSTASLPGGQVGPRTTRASSYLWSGLEPGTRYIFHVRASSEAGASEPSAPVSVDTPADPSAPEAPGSFTATRTRDNHALLEWTPPEPSPERDPVTGYRVYRQVAGVRIESRTTDALSYLWSGLEPGKSYVFHVRAMSNAGPSEPSASDSVFVEASSDPSAPQAPGSFTATLTPDNHVMLKWTPPEPSDRHAPVVKYEVYLQSAGGLAPPIGRTDSLSYLYTDPLSPGTRYVFHVRALDSQNRASPASESAFVDAPGIPAVALAIPHMTVRADEGDPDSEEQKVRISWSHRPPSEDEEDEEDESPIVLTGFNLQYCKVPSDHSDAHCPAANGGWAKHPDSPDESPTTRALTDEFECVPKEARMYRMKALGEIGGSPVESLYSDPTRPVCPSADYSPPSRVNALYAKTTNDYRVNVCWNVPEHNNSWLTGYELQITFEEDPPSTEDGWLVVDAYVDPGTEPPPPPPPPVCRLYSGLAGGDVVWFRVRAYNLAGHGLWSAPYHYRHGESIVPEQSSRAAAAAESPDAAPTVSVLSVAAASAEENDPAGLVFTVSVTPPSDAGVRVRYDTESGSAAAGRDFEPASGMLEIPGGESVATVAVRLFDDEEPEGAETLVLRLSEPEGARIDRGEAIGTIEPSDPTPQAWLSRFGQSFTIGTVDALRARVASPPAADTYTPWVRVGARGFSSTDPWSEISGSVGLASLGVERAAESWHGGIGLTHGTGSGSHGDADFDADLTAVHPYIALHFDRHLTLWGALGAGSGSVQMDSSLADDSTDITWRLGAVGARGGLLSTAEGDPLDLDWVADASWAEMESSATAILRSSRTDFSRLTSGVDLARSLSLDGGSVFAPSLSLALVHDEGDAREGTGLDAELSLRYEAPLHGFHAAAELSRLVVSDDASGWGLSGALAYDPGAAGRGLSLTVSPRTGVAGDADWSLSGSSPSFETSLDVLARYGRGASSWSPYTGLRLSDGAGYRAGLERITAGDLSMRIETRMDEEVEIWSQGAVRW